MSHRTDPKQGGKPGQRSTSGSSPNPAGRLFGVLLRRASPSLGAAAAKEATDTFQRLWAEARGSGLRSSLAFLLREIRSLVQTARSERAAKTTPRCVTAGPSPTVRHRRGMLASLSEFIRWDVRLALRHLARSPGFVAVSLLSLAFGIGVSTVLFTALNSLVFRPTPYVQDPDALVRIVSTHRGRGRGPSAYPDFEDFRRSLASLEDVAAFRGGDLAVTTKSGETRMLRGLQVSEDYFDLLGIPLSRGRAFLPEDIASGGEVAVIGYELWQRTYDADPDILGRTIRINGRPFTIVGVGPPGMTGLSAPVLVEAVVPVQEGRDDRGHLSLGIVGRMREGVTLPQVQEELDALAQHMVETHPGNWNLFGENPRGLRALTELQARLPEGVPTALLSVGFLAVVGLILLIACSNVANLLLSRALQRRSEIAVRGAIGASRRRILTQFLTENLLLFGSAGILGLWVSSLLAGLARLGLPSRGFPGANLSVDLKVGIFAMGVSMLTGLTFGLLPALRASRADPMAALKGGTTGRRVRRLSLRSLLVGGQVAGSLVLVLVTLLLIQGLSHARTLDLGFDPSRVAVLSLDLDYGGYGKEDGQAWLASLTERLRSLSGVEEVALGSIIPLQGGGEYLGGVEPEGYELAPEEQVTLGFATVSPGYLDVVGMRLLRGRDFTPGDDEDGVKVALVNQAFVDRYWPGEDGLGRYVGMRGSDERVEVVGVVANARYHAVDEDPPPHIWYPFAQSRRSDVIVHIRTAGDPRGLLPTFRQQVRDLDPELPILRADLMANVTDNATAPQRVLSSVLGAAGLMALALAMLGIYGVIGYSVSQRRREVGLRIALGAHPRRVVGMVVREGVLLSLVGLLPGLVLGGGAALALRSIFLGVSPLSPTAVAASAALLVLGAALASLAPALRAAGAHPMEALRVE